MKCGQNSIFHACTTKRTKNIQNTSKKKQTTKDEQEANVEEEEEQEERQVTNQTENKTTPITWLALQIRNANKNNNDILGSEITALVSMRQAKIVFLVSICALL